MPRLVSSAIVHSTEHQFRELVTPSSAARLASPEAEQKSVTQTPTQTNTKSGEHYAPQVHMISSENEVEVVEEISSLVSENDSNCEDGEFAGFSSTSNTTILEETVSESQQRFEPSQQSIESSEVSNDDEPNTKFLQQLPAKRRKHQNESPSSASPHDRASCNQIVEINSDSTTHSENEKRLQRHTKFQLNLSQQQTYYHLQRQQQLHKTSSANSKCSTESTSEFPVSSPSNPRPCGKHTQRPPLLKNTLPTDAFERKLTMITSRNPQMTLAEKIRTWQCDSELSDVEDVNSFDESFRKYEENKRKQLKSLKKERNECVDMRNYDFMQFRTMMFHNLSTSPRKKRGNSGSGSSSSVQQAEEKAATSAAGHAIPRLTKPPAVPSDTGGLKKRLQRESNRRTQTSTTPPVTSSSENDVTDCYQNIRRKKSPDKLLCRRHSEETSQDASRYKIQTTHELISTDNGILTPKLKCLPIEEKVDRVNNAAAVTLGSSGAQDYSQESPPPNPQSTSMEDLNSVFKLDRSSREIDKNSKTPKSPLEQHEQAERLKRSGGLIQMRLDFLNDKKDLHLREKKQELFKTPSVPQKYLTAPHQTSYKGAESTSVNKNAKVSPNSALLLVPSTEPSDQIQIVSNSGSFSVETVGSDVGGFHQQHEFCNYLGLTGMSTANAVANAVAELAQCNLARRSMRVLRQQQQERKEKTAKEERELQALKGKQLYELKRSEKGSCDLNVTNEPTLNGDERSPSSESAPLSLPLPKSVNSMGPLQRKASNASKETNFLVRPRPSLTIVKKEPEIKILCHIATAGKEEAEKVSKEYGEELTAPIRDTLLRRLNVAGDIGSVKKIGRRSCPLTSTTTATTQDLDESVSSLDQIVDRVTTNSRARLGVMPVLKTEVKIEEDSVLKTPDLNIKHKPPSTPPIPEAAASDKITKLNLKSIDGEREGEDGRTKITFPVHELHRKFQAYLEESRKTKPSIFIVQSLKSEGSTKIESSDRRADAREEFVKLPEMLDEPAKMKSATNKKLAKKKSVMINGRKNKAYLRSSYKLNQRQLRSRKIVIVKTIKLGRRIKPKERISLGVKKHLAKCLETEMNGAKVNSAKEANERTSPKTKKTQSLDPETGKSNSPEVVVKSDKHVQTETNDLEAFLEDAQLKMTERRTRSNTIRTGFSKSSLLERSRRMSLRRSTTNLRSKVVGKKVVRSKLLLRSSPPQISKTNAHFAEVLTKTNALVNYSSFTTNDQNDPHQDQNDHQQGDLANNKNNTEQMTTASLQPDNENVVVSSTTNSYDVPSNELKNLHPNASYVMARSIETKDSSTQSDVGGGIRYLCPPATTQMLKNPLKEENGPVLHIYYELDVLIVIQEWLVSFWKYSKLINVLSTPYSQYQQQHQHTNQQQQDYCQNPYEPIAPLLPQLSFIHQRLREPSSSSLLADATGEWLLLGELRRSTYDIEISAPFSNRICVHNSIPIYVEMRACQIPRNHRDCNLLSMYINIYFYHDEEMISKMNSIQLDTIQGDVNQVIFTTITDSRYFIITWPQENILSKTRSGLCKYSLTPQLDTLASIREFKSMRHSIRYLECISDGKLLGIGETQLTIWDHRSGDVLMNYDLDMPLGRNLGSIYYPNQDIGQNNMILLFQYIHFEEDVQPELLNIACNISHSAPSHRILHQQKLPMPAFKKLVGAINTGDHLVITAQNDEEIWISCTDPSLMTCVPAQHTKRFYARGRTQLIELTEKTLNVDTFSNYVLKLAAGIA